MEMLDYKYLGELVQSAREGDSNAFAELYAATYQQQYRYALRYLKDEHLAQDALQETFVRVLRNIRKLQNPDLFIAWLNRINFRVCYDISRSRSKDNNVIYNEVPLKMQHSEVGLAEDEVLKIDQREYILKQIKSLPLTESQVIIMKYYQEMKLDEIAEAMNISRSTVKRYLKSGKNHLKQMLEQYRS